MQDEALQDRIKIDDFRWLQSWLKESASVVLEDGRKFLAEKRLVTLVWRYRFKDFGELFAALRAVPGSELGKQCRDLMANGETWFFRDPGFFEWIRSEILPTLIEQRKGTQTLNFWSAGCSSGQEAYSLALLIKHNFPQLSGWRLNILGTDISEDAIAKAKAGLFTKDEIQRGLPVALVMKYFKQDNALWSLSEEIRSMVAFHTMRLDAPGPELPRFDLILLRNVVSAFDADARRSVLSQMAQLLSTEGKLFLGTAEKLEPGVALDEVRKGDSWCYKVPEPAAAKAV